MHERVDDRASMDEKVKSIFKEKTLLITGGTGSFGNAVLRHFLNTDIKEIRIFSRDELKQDNMRKKYNHPKLKFYLGDVRDLNSLDDAMRGADYVFHAAALKQVPSCEFYPMQAVQTNVDGTENVLNSAIQQLQINYIQEVKTETNAPEVKKESSKEKQSKQEKELKKGKTVEKLKKKTKK